tara:strand:+ start:1085 stop:1654 length:570 start_codon:yes stop_codon:yes gene_type:complete
VKDQMKKEYKNLMITDHDEMECEILGIARLELKVGLKWFAEDVDEKGAKGVYFYGIDQKKPENELASFEFYDVTEDPEELDTTQMNEGELSNFSAFAQNAIGKQLDLVAWGDWFTIDLNGGIRAFGVKYKVNEPTVGIRSVYSLRTTYKNKKYCALFQVNDKELGFLRFYKFLKQALEGIEFFDKAKLH